MKKIFFVSIVVSMATMISGCNNQSSSSKENFGRQLFNDVSLSRDGTQSCASCHDSQQAFIDSRINITSKDGVTPGAVSTGQDQVSLGDINAPSAMYTAFNPGFHFDETEQLYVGGVFLDGRATDIVKQAKQPFLNPVEMQNTKENVVITVMNKYADTMQEIYGNDIFSETDKAFDAIADAIASFERTEEFTPFNSKFDKFLRGEVVLSDAEQRGMGLFIADNKGNCAACHPVPSKGSSQSDRLFTDFTYDNLGVPKNNLVRSNNGKGSDFIDNGLFNNKAVNDEGLKGAFRVQSLRNVAVTPPYMHNGVFSELSTVVKFYNSRDVVGAINPETGNTWGPAEVDATKNTDELGNLGLTEQEISDIVAFLKTLTDEKYEHLIN